MAATVRRAEKDDLPRVAALAGALVRMHHETDPDRFLLPDNVENGYAWWFEKQLQNKDAVILVAENGTEILGYCYGALEGRDWNLLLDTHGAIHDVYVIETARGAGVGLSLLQHMISDLTSLGAPRIVLSTMIGNKSAQRTFARAGFRPTMLEMTR